MVTTCTSSPFNSRDDIDAVIVIPRSASLHTWALFVRGGDITSAKSIESPDKPLCEEITYTYIEGGLKTWEQVGRGWWVTHNPEEDDLTPETTFTDRRLAYLLTTKAGDQD